MHRRRAQMIQLSTGQPLDTRWQPLLEPGELALANAQLAARQLSFRLIWLPATVHLQGTATLLTA
jgi:hypothetical protein